MKMPSDDEVEKKESKRGSKRNSTGLTDTILSTNEPGEVMGTRRTSVVSTVDGNARTSSSSFVITKKTSKQERRRQRISSSSTREGEGDDDHSDSGESDNSSIHPGAVAIEGRNSTLSRQAHPAIDDGNVAVDFSEDDGRQRTQPVQPPPIVATISDVEHNTVEPPKVLLQAEIAPDIEEAIALALAERDRQQQASMVSAVEIRPIDNHDGNKNEESCIRKCTPTWSRIGQLVLAVIIIVAAVGVSVALFASSDDTGNQNSSAAKDDFVSDLPSDTDDGNLLTAPTASPTLNGSVNTLKPTMDSSSSSTVARGGMIVPLYTWPIMDDSGQNCIDENYQRIATSTIAEQTIVIINPDDGPNYGKDFWTKQSFDVCISYLRNHGVTVIGYVPTKNTNTLNATEDCSTTNDSCSDLYRDVSSLKSDIDTWFGEYDGIQGIFLDNIDDMWTWEEQGWDSLVAVLSYNHDLVNHALAKSEESYVVLNPRGAFPEGLMEPYYGNTRVIAVVFESSQLEYQPSRCTDLLYTSERGSFNRG